MLAGLCAFVGFFTAAAVLQVASGAWASEFGAFEDEPAHLVTALMIRDWLASGDFASPRAFAEEYYVHYPKVGIGQWPPVFHGLLGAWMLAAGTSAASVLVFLSLIGSAIAFTIFRILKGPLGSMAGALAGGLYLSIPIVQECGGSAMTESMIGLFGLSAVLAWGRFLDDGKAGWAWLFACAASLTILTKGSGLALGLVPPISILMTGRFDLLRRPVLWAAALLVAGLVAPWYALTLSLSQGTWSGGGSPNWAFTALAAERMARWLPALGGWAAVVLVPVGMAWGVRREGEGGRWAALAAWVPSVLILHLTIPSSVEERHLAAMAPAWTVLSALGAGALGRGLVRWGRGRQGAGGAQDRRAGAAPAIAVAASAALMWASHGRLAGKQWSGFGTSAAELLAAAEDPAPRTLIASDPVGEGLFVAGFALADSKRPGHLVMRGSKVLGNAGWSGYDYEQRFEGVSGARRFLHSRGVGCVAIDGSTRSTRHWFPHLDQLVSLVTASDGDWRLISSNDVVRKGVAFPGALKIYRHADWESLPMPEIALRDVLRR